jgi:ADP-heptose:LPS heptosyltransferase
MNRIGDMICTIPLIKTLRKEFPEAELTVIAENTNAEIIKNASYIDRVIILNKRKGIFRNKHLKLWKILKDCNFDMAIGVKAGFSSNLAVATFLSGSRYRVGYIPDDFHPLNLLYNIPVKKSYEPMHQVEQCLNLLLHIGIDPARYIRNISLEIPEISRATVKRFLEASNIENGTEKIIVLNISNSGPETTWQLENFIELLKELKTYDLRSIITSAPSDIDKAKKIVEASTSALLLETPNIMDLAAIAEVSDLFICHDSGAMHIGAAVGVRTLVLVGRGITPEVWGPYGTDYRCLKKNNLNEITVQEVIREISDMLNK